MERGTTSCVPVGAYGAFSGKVDTGFPQKMRPDKNLERGTRALERPRAGDAPVFRPPGQVAFAELERKGRVGWIEAGDGWRSEGEEDFRAGPAGMVDQRHAERGLRLVGRHAEGEGNGVGLRPAIGRPAHP